MNKKIIGLLVFVLFLSICSLSGQTSNPKLERLNIHGHNAVFGQDASKLVYVDQETKEYMHFDLKSKESKALKISAKGNLIRHGQNHRLLIQDRKSLDQFTFLGQQSSAKRTLLKEDIVAYPAADLRSIILYVDGLKKVLEPLDLTDYINVSISPDQSKILFRASGLGSFVIDLQGNIITKFKSAEFPSWLNNSKILFAVVEDNGHQYTSSSLFIGDIYTKALTNIDLDRQLVPLFPSCNYDGSKVTFNTPENHIYVLSIK